MNKLNAKHSDTYALALSLLILHLFFNCLRNILDSSPMSVITYRFFLERQEPLYLSGELVKGFVELYTELDLKRWEHLFNAKLVGICQNKWQQKPGKWQLLQRQEQIFSNRNKFYANFCWFISSHIHSGYGLKETADEANEPVASQKSQNRLNQYTYKFQFQLIRQLPTSCITPNGYIQYKIKLDLGPYRVGNNIWQPIAHGDDKYITIVRALNPNGIHLYAQLWTLEVKPLLKCYLTQSCFAPGQDIHFKLSLQNARYLNSIKSIVVELQESQHHWGCNSNHPIYKHLDTRYTMDTCSFDDIKYSHELFKKHEHCLNFKGILKIPSTTVPSSNYPIYPKYACYHEIRLFIYHLINIKIIPRFKWLRVFRAKGYEKLITIGTQPMHSKLSEPAKEVDKNVTNNGNVFKCLEENSESSLRMQAFIPKYVNKEIVADISQELEEVFER